MGMLGTVSMVTSSLETVIAQAIVNSCSYSYSCSYSDCCSYSDITDCCSYSDITALIAVATGMRNTSKNTEIVNKFLKK